MVLFNIKIENQANNGEVNIVCNKTSIEKLDKIFPNLKLKENLRID